MYARMKPVVLAAALVVATGALAHTEKGGDAKPQGRTNAAQVDKLTQGWPAASRGATRFMTEKYGSPAAVTADMASWGKTGVWKRRVVLRVATPHSFPKLHTEVMQQWIDYEAPPSRYDELALYDGSVVLERTSGEISARCGREAANLLALNLTDEIVKGKGTVERASRKYGEQIKATMARKPAPLTEGCSSPCPATPGIRTSPCRACDPPTASGTGTTR